MFLIGTNPDLPATARSRSAAGAPMQALNTGGDSYMAPLQPIDSTAGNLLAVTGTTAIAITDGSGTITLPVGTNAIAIAVSGAPSYRPAIDGTNPQPGEFVQVGAVVTLTLRSGDLPTSINYVGLLQQYPFSIPTDEIVGPFPDLYTRWPLDGEVKYTRTFEGHPSADFTFVTDAVHTDDVLATFANRNPIALYDMGFEVDSCTIDELPLSLYPSGKIIVSVKLCGRHEYLSNEPLFERTFNSRGYEATTVAQMAQRVGLNVVGNTMGVTIAPDVSYASTTTVENLLSEYKRLATLSDGTWAGGFVYWSNPAAIELRSFSNTQEHFLSNADLLSDLSTSYPGKLIRWQGVQLVEEYRKAVLQFNDKTPESVSIKVIVEPKEDPAVPFPVDDLKSAGTAFDNGGPTKSQKTTKYIGKTVVQESEVTFGYAFAAVDVYSVVNIAGQGAQAVYTSGVNPAVYWKKTRETTTVWDRDQVGYLQQISEVGTRLTRLKSESADKPETLDLMLARDNTTDTTYADLTAQIAPYQFNLVAPTEKITIYELSPLATYFPDTPISPGEPTAKFCSREHTYENSKYSAPDPASTRDTPLPPIVTGKQFDQVISRSITCQAKGREAYMETTITQNSEGTNLKNGLAISNTRYVPGRPPPHDLSADAIVLTGSRFPSKRVANTNLKYLLLVQGSIYTSQIDRGSKGYTTRFVEDARLAAQLDLAIVNSQRSASASPQVRHDRRYQEGDLLWVKGKKDVIFGISWSEKITQGMITCEGMALTLGRLLEIPVVLQTVPAYF